MQIQSSSFLDKLFQNLFLWKIKIHTSFETLNRFPSKLIPVISLFCQTFIKEIQVNRPRFVVMVFHKSKKVSKFNIEDCIIQMNFYRKFKLWIKKFIEFLKFTKFNTDGSKIHTIYLHINLFIFMNFIPERLLRYQILTRSFKARCSPLFVRSQETRWCSLLRCSRVSITEI